MRRRPGGGQRFPALRQAAPAGSHGQPLVPAGTAGAPNPVSRRAADFPCAPGTGRRTGMPQDPFRGPENQARPSTERFRASRSRAEIPRSSATRQIMFSSNSETLPSA